MQVCHNCALMTPRAIGEVRGALASLRARGHQNLILDLLRQELEQQGGLSGDDIAIVVGLGRSKSLDASDTRSVGHQADAQRREVPPRRSSGACPSCGGRNFGWAKKCDHCGQSLAQLPCRSSGVAPGKSK